MKLYELVASEIAPFIRKIGGQNPRRRPEPKKELADIFSFDFSDENDETIPLPTASVYTSSYGVGPKTNEATTHSIDLSDGSIGDDDLDQIKVGDKIFIDQRPFVISKLKTDYVNKKATFYLISHDPVEMEIV